MNKIVITFLGSFLILTLGSSSAYSSTTPHPIEMYDKGLAVLENYRGNPSELEKAQKIFLNVIEKFPNSPFGYLGMSRLQLIKAYRYGNIFNMKNIREDVLPFAIRALELGPSIRDVHEHYIVFENIFEEYYKNQQLAQENLALRPENPETFFIVANFLHDQSEVEKSLSYYETALELNPPLELKLRILQRIALIYLQDKVEPEKAIQYYSEALKMNENSPVLNEYLGIAYLKSKQYELSIETLTKALNLLKTDPPKYHLLEAKGYLSIKNGKTVEAIDFLEKAAEFGFLDSNLHYNLGNLYYKTEDYENAFNHFKVVIDLAPDNSDAYYFAGRAIHSLGYTDIAIDYYKKYLQFNLETQEADWIRNNIPELSHKTLNNKVE